MDTLLISELDRIRFLVLYILLVPVSETFTRFLVSLEPEKHAFEWVACLAGAILGMSYFRPDSITAALTGFFSGYLAGLWGGAILAIRMSWQTPQLAMFLISLITDVALRSVAYGIKHPDEAMAFFSKILGIFGSELFDKAAGAVIRVIEFFRRKP